jgi:hypothetical protein
VLLLKTLLKPQTKVCNVMILSSTLWQLTDPH